MNKTQEIIVTVSSFLTIPILLLLLVVPMLIVANLSPTTREQFNINEVRTNVLGSQSIILEDVEIRINNFLLSQGYVIQDDSNIILEITHLSKEKHTVFTNSVLLSNKSSVDKTIYVFLNNDYIPTDVEGALVVDDVSNVVFDVKGNIWPQEIHLAPGEELLIGFRVDSKNYLHNDLVLKYRLYVK